MTCGDKPMKTTFPPRIFKTYEAVCFVESAVPAGFDSKGPAIDIVVSVSPSCVKTAPRSAVSSLLNPFDKAMAAAEMLSVRSFAVNTEKSPRNIVCRIRLTCKKSRIETLIVQGDKKVP